MTVQADEKETLIIEALAREAEMVLEVDITKKDLKEKREIIKKTLYEGSKKLKHIVPKGVRI